ncbi:HIT-like protein [bacterium BMS3Abin01]|nr:HIT-like protein [bacterium BMS3Abin01]HDY69316.1 HIT domain-containing protein [Actinomycetota bacterium]
MSNNDCLFCSIIDGNGLSGSILENEEFVAIWDKYPKAPVHALIIPRLHLESLNDIDSMDGDLCKRMLEFIVATADKLQVKEPGYRVITNVGTGGGQVIFHIHWHLLAGRSVGFDLGEGI